MCAAAAAGAMFLPWQTGVDEGAAQSVAGTGTSEGQLVLVVSLVTVGLVQVGWRPAWIGAGLASASTIRVILKLSGEGKADPAVGLWIAAAASVVATAFLVWDMFANVTPAGEDDARPGRRGLSGPLGRRRP